MSQNLRKFPEKKSLGVPYCAPVMIHPFIAIFAEIFLPVFNLGPRSSDGSLKYGIYLTYKSYGILQQVVATELYQGCGFINCYT